MIPKKLIEILSFAIKNLFYGEISIKFNAGKIVNIERRESIKI